MQFNIPFAASEHCAAHLKHWQNNWKAIQITRREMRQNIFLGDESLWTKIAFPALPAAPDKGLRSAVHKSSAQFPRGCFLTIRAKSGPILNPVLHEAAEVKR